MRIAVTGPTGFVGRHVVDRLAAQNAEVVLVPRRTDAEFPSLPDAEVVALDIGEATAETYDRLGRPDVLLHLAWGGLPNYKSLHHFEDELPAQYAFLKAMVEAGLPAMVVTGTCFEYGMQSGPLHEGLETRPNNPYAFAKDALRRQLSYLQTDTSFGLTWARLFYMYGPGQAKNSLLPQLERAAEAGDAVFNMSGGEQLRDYMRIEDVAETLVKLALGPADAGVVNVCSGTPISVRTLVEDRIAENGWEIELNRGYYPYPAHEPMAFWGDRSKLARVLGEEQAG